jgi:phosphoribosylanthranilate isomerase
LVGKMPSGPGPIADELIASIARTIPPPIASFLLTSEQEPEAIVSHVKRTGVNTVQIVDELTGGNYLQIKNELPHIRIVQVIHVRDENAIAEALSVQKFVDAILLDSGNPKASIKTLGGTGNIHNWDVSGELVQAVNVPVFLAGGLREDNVKHAINKVKPFGVDLCSGVRTDGKLDEKKLKAFISAVANN